MPFVKPLETGVYCIRNKKNGKVYVGSAAVSLADRISGHRGALRSGRHRNKYLQNAWNKYGEDAFEFVILERCAAAICLIREQHWMNHYKSYNRNHGYNISPTAGSQVGMVHTNETKAKMSSVRKGVKKSPETRAKMAAAAIGKSPTAETRAKISKANTGRQVKPEWVAKIKESLAKPDVKARMREVQIGKKMSEETKEKIRIAHKGKKRSPEAIAKTADYWRGRKHTEESKAKMSATRKKLWEERRQMRCLFD